MTDMERFDDPRLKSAICQLYQGHQAAPELRAQIAAQLAAGLAHPKPARWPITYWIAGAAVLLVAISSGAGYFVHEHHLQQAMAAEARNDSLLNKLVRLHKTGHTCEDVQVLTSLDDPSGLAAEASGLLCRSVPVANLRDQGWIVDAANVCTIASQPSLRIHYVRRNQALTLVSLPVQAYAGAAEGSHYELMNNGCSIAGYVCDGSFICLLGDASVSIDEAARLRDLVHHGF